MILQKYETEESKREELRLGNLYVRCYEPKSQVINLGFLSPFDFAIKKSGELYGYLEVKVKNGWFSTYEIIPQNKWNFLEKSEFPCFLLIEREGTGRLFDLNEILRSGRFYPTEIKRREDQPGGSRKVVKFRSDTGKNIYFL
jgi:hypothetical protein